MFKVANLFQALQKSRVDWQFYAQSSRACRANVGGCFWPRGRMLGGSSAMNFMVYVRGNDRDYDRWEQEFGIPGWNYETALKYFKKSEGNQQPSFVQYDDGRYHSACGPQKIDLLGSLTPFQEMLIEAANEKGIPTIDDINADKLTGYVNLQGTYFQGRRWSAAKSFLIPAKDRPNLDVIKHAFVKKILINEKNQAYGVKFDYKGITMKAYCRKEVVLSAGAVMSPVILMHSGIGPRCELKKYKISVKSDLPVGKNLIDHLYTLVWLKFNPSQTSPLDSLDSTYNLAIHNSGSLASAAQPSGFINTFNNSIYPDIQTLIHYYPAKSPDLRSYLDQYAYNDNFKSKLIAENENHDIVGFIVADVQPKSRGYIKLGGSSPCDRPKIRPKYLSHPEDMNTMLQGVKQQLSFLDTEAYQANGGEFIWIPIEECDRFPFKSDDYLKCYIAYSSGTTYHPLGTSKMGSDSDPTAVVDQFLRVRGIDGLRQIDAGM